MRFQKLLALLLSLAILSGQAGAAKTPGKPSQTQSPKAAGRPGLYQKPDPNLSEAEGDQPLPIPAAPPEERTRIHADGSAAAATDGDACPRYEGYTIVFDGDWCPVFQTGTPFLFEGGPEPYGMMVPVEEFLQFAAQRRGDSAWFAVSLETESPERVLWVEAGSGFGNVATQIGFTADIANGQIVGNWTYWDGWPYTTWFPYQVREGIAYVPLEILPGFLGAFPEYDYWPGEQEGTITVSSDLFPSGTLEDTCRNHSRVEGCLYSNYGRRRFFAGSVAYQTWGGDLTKRLTLRRVTAQIDIMAELNRIAIEQGGAPIDPAEGWFGSPLEHWYQVEAAVEMALILKNLTLDDDRHSYRLDTFQALPGYTFATNLWPWGAASVHSWDPDAPGGPVVTTWWKALDAEATEFLWQATGNWSGMEGTGTALYEHAYSGTYSGSLGEIGTLFDRREVVDGRLVFSDAKPDSGWFSRLLQSGLLRTEEFSRAIAEEILAQDSVVSEIPDAELVWHVQTTALADFIERAVSDHIPQVRSRFRIVRWENPSDGGDENWCKVPDHDIQPIPELPDEEPLPVIPPPPSDPSISPDGGMSSEAEAGVDEQALIRFAEAIGDSIAAQVQALEEQASRPAPRIAGEGDKVPPFLICHPAIMFNGQEVELHPAYPMFEQDGKIYFPLHGESLAAIGLIGAYGREYSLWGDGPRLIHLAKSNRIVTFAPSDPDWALFNFRRARAGMKIGRERLIYGGVDTIRMDREDEFYYIDIGQVATMMGGWAVSSADSPDGRYHIRIPQQTGTWLSACELEGYSFEAGNLADCDVVSTQVIDSYWEKQWHEHGPYAIIGETRRLLLHYLIKIGQDPFGKRNKQDVMANDAKEWYNPLGILAEETGYHWFWGEVSEMAQYAPNMALIAFQVIVARLGSGYRNQVNRNPARTYVLARETEILLREQLQGLGLSQAQIEAHLAEAGFTRYPISVTGKNTPANLYAPGFYFRVYGAVPDNHGFWYLQTKLAGQPDPYFFTLNGKSYVVVVDYSDGKRWMDGYGKPINWESNGRPVRLEVKTGYESHVRKDGTFDGDLKIEVLKWLKNFENDVLRAAAGKEEAIWAFTNARTEQAFHNAVKAHFGEKFYQAHQHRIIYTTDQVIVPPGNGVDPTPPPTLPPTPVPTP